MISLSALAHLCDFVVAPFQFYKMKTSARDCVHCSPPCNRVRICVNKYPQEDRPVTLLSLLTPKHLQVCDAAEDAGTPILKVPITRYLNTDWVTHLEINGLRSPLLLMRLLWQCSRNIQMLTLPLRAHGTKHALLPADFAALRHVAIASNVVVLELWFTVLEQVITKANTWSFSDHTALLHPEIGQLELRLTAWTPKLDSVRCCLWSDASCSPSYAA